MDLFDRPGVFGETPSYPASVKNKTAQMPIKAQTARMYTHRGSGAAGIFFSGDDRGTEGGAE
jgi:hypothetical protein